MTLGNSFRVPAWRRKSRHRKGGRGDGGKRVSRQNRDTERVEA